MIHPFKDDSFKKRPHVEQSHKAWACGIIWTWVGTRVWTHHLVDFMPTSPVAHGIMGAPNLQNGFTMCRVRSLNTATPGLKKDFTWKYCRMLCQLLRIQHPFCEAHPIQNVRSNGHGWDKTKIQRKQHCSDTSGLHTQTIEKFVYSWTCYTNNYNRNLRHLTNVV